MTFRIRLEPLGVTLEAGEGTRLRDILFPYGVEFPCGGHGMCGRCRVHTAGDEALLACRTDVHSDLVLQIGGWSDSILTAAPGAIPRGKGRGIAVDLGTTTVVAQLVDGESGQILGTRAELNEQATFGADVMSRIEHALHPQGRLALRDRIVSQVRRLMHELSEESVPVVVAGNTAMHHLFGGLDVTPLSRAPFTPEYMEELRVPPHVRFLAPVGGFVGSDVLAGIIATGMYESSELCVLLDLGTNGEIVVGSRDGMVCASTAAGPAFEGGRISCGMRAATGAIVSVETGGVFEVLGRGTARGICGSGLVDVAAVSLDDGSLSEAGRIQNESRTISLIDDLHLRQSDIRELQLAKAAIVAGLDVLLPLVGAKLGDIARLYLAGAFGNYVRQTSARRIGLIPFDDQRVVPVGNASLAGARLLLFDSVDLESIRQRIRHVSLHSDPGFQDAYVDHMRFPPLRGPYSAVTPLSS